MVLLTFSSSKIVDHSVVLACNWAVPPILIGVVLVSLGTDFPEIMNSIISSSLGHGSINVGDSIGSAFAQLTPVLGIIALSLKQFEVNRKEVFAIGIVTLRARDAISFIKRESRQKSWSYLPQFIFVLIQFTISLLLLNLRAHITFNSPVP